MSRETDFLGNAYIKAIREHYPELMSETALQSIDEQLHIGFVRRWSHSENIVGVDPPSRFQTMDQRSFAMLRNAWSTSADGSAESGLRRLGASSSHKGLIHLKPPYDLVLYSSLIWELRPATILEFGALQGGSGLWLADQIDICHLEAEVHSFELLDKCIHPSARHERLHFHRADLRDLNSLDDAWLSTLKHPWLVVDDAHENLAELMSLIGGMLQVGDYYVIEDVLLNPTPDVIVAWVQLCTKLNLLVDSKYTDAFGYNVTCSPNGWLRKF
jgi:cephalosporin hydroxylase